MAQQRLERGRVPLHLQVYLDLRETLDAGGLPPGARLPPERALAARYGCSLIPVRRALDELVREERIERTRGRGTFALAPRVELFGAGTKSFADEMRERGLRAETRLVDAGGKEATEAIATALGLPVGAPIWTITRLRVAGGAPLILEEASLSAARFPSLLESDFATQSLYGVLADRFGIQIVRARESLEPVIPAPREAKLLGLAKGRPALLIEGVAFAAGGKPIEYTRSHVRGDRTRYYVDRVVARQGESRGLRRSGAGLGAAPEPPEPRPSTGFNL